MNGVNKVSIALLFAIAITSCDSFNGSSSTTTSSSTKEPIKPKIEAIQEANPYIKIGKKDSAGNEVDNGKQKLYLTFDDGPNPGTRSIIDALKEFQFPATFYMIGLHRYYQGNEDALWKEVNSIPYFEVCNHSFTHAYRNQFAKFYSDLPGALNDFVRNQDSLKFNNRIVRAPGSNEWRLPTVYATDMVKLRDRITILDSLYKMGYYLTGWDWEWAHKNNVAKGNAAQIYSEIKSLFKNQKLKKPNHLVLLTHDAIFKDTADAAQLRQFFAMVKADTAIELRTISQYPGAQDAFK